jgi:hypothetical protein
MGLSREQVATMVVALVGGALVIASYAYLATSSPGGGYLDTPLWNGIGRHTVIALVAMQVLAAVGAVAAIGTWIANPPKGGLMSRTGALPATLAVFLTASALWGFLMAMKTPSKAGVSVTLIVAAATSIAMLAGSAEESAPRWWVVLGLLLLCATTVLADAVVWQSRFMTTP